MHAPSRLREEARRFTMRTMPRQALDRMEAPHQRQRGIDEIADHKIDLLTVNWMLFQGFATRRDLAVPPFQLPRRKVDLVQEIHDTVQCVEELINER